MQEPISLVVTVTFHACLCALPGKGVLFRTRLCSKQNIAYSAAFDSLIKEKKKGDKTSSQMIDKPEFCLACTVCSRLDWPLFFAFIRLFRPWTCVTDSFNSRGNIKLIGRYSLLQEK
ncbi:hypothetical protein EDC96DRAFT_529209 [Choanephora cucurbitarum]|nr:hypothetical protein EDC96DRAFT_529209 [Choanephora cucurbitarum]